MFLLQHERVELQNEGMLCAGLVAERKNHASVILERRALQIIIDHVNEHKDEGGDSPFNFWAAANMFGNLCKIPKVLREFSRSGAVEALVLCSHKERRECELEVSMAIAELLSNIELYLLDKLWPGLIHCLVEPLVNVADDLAKQAMKRLEEKEKDKDDDENEGDGEGDGKERRDAEVETEGDGAAKPKVVSRGEDEEKSLELKIVESCLATLPKVLKLKEFCITYAAQEGVVMPLLQIYDVKTAIPPKLGKVSLRMLFDLAAHGTLALGMAMVAGDEVGMGILRRGWEGG